MRALILKQHELQNVFDFRNEVVSDYSRFSRSFSTIRAQDIKDFVDVEYDQGRYWPEPLIQINPNYKTASTVPELVKEGLLHPECEKIFQTGKPEGNPSPLRLFTHQQEALGYAQSRESYIVTTGTGSGKSLSFFIPIIDAILKTKDLDPKPRTKAIVIYPMNALANSQLEEIKKFQYGYADNARPFSVGRYTGQETTGEREFLAANPPDILLTNFMMLELILTRFEETDRKVVDNCRGLEFLVLDELHTYRGRQGADVALLVRRLRNRLEADKMVCIGTSATMSNTGSEEDQKSTVAKVATVLFGREITRNRVIGETLERTTDPLYLKDKVIPLLKARVTEGSRVWSSLEEFRHDPLAIWVELTLGLAIKGTGGYQRAVPVSLSQAAQVLAKDAEVPLEEAQVALRDFLTNALDLATVNGRQPFAFKLHQFISGAGKVLCTLEAPTVRTITLNAQRFAPGKEEQNAFLYPTYFCRECGQEYHPVEQDQVSRVWMPREIDDPFPSDEIDRFGYLVPWDPDQNYTGDLEELPEHWIDHTGPEPRVKREYKARVPVSLSVGSNGIAGGGTQCWFLPGKVQFCPCCNLVHEAYGKDSNRLTSLSGEGRSSATTMITLSVLQNLFANYQPGGFDPRKLLGFSDNRQDAALQSGHFNDFLFLITLRGGLVSALEKAGGQLEEEELSSRVFKALGFDSDEMSVRQEYLRSPDIYGPDLTNAQRALRFVLGYRLMRDLRKGWRYNNPNLEQLNILEIGFQGLDAFCAEERRFEQAHPILRELNPSQRLELANFVLSEMRRNLCIHSDFFASESQDQIKTKLSYLTERWRFAPDESLTTTSYLVMGKRPESKGKVREDTV